MPLLTRAQQKKQISPSLPSSSPPVSARSAISLVLNDNSGWRGGRLPPSIATCSSDAELESRVQRRTHSSPPVVSFTVAPSATPYTSLSRSAASSSSSSSYFLRSASPRSLLQVSKDNECVSSPLLEYYSSTGVKIPSPGIKRKKLRNQEEEMQPKESSDQLETELFDDETEELPEEERDRGSGDDVSAADADDEREDFDENAVTLLIPSSTSILSSPVSCRYQLRSRPTTPLTNNKIPSTCPTSSPTRVAFATMKSSQSPRRISPHRPAVFSFRSLSHLSQLQTSISNSNITNPNKRDGLRPSLSNSSSNLSSLTQNSTSTTLASARVRTRSEFRRYNDISPPLSPIKLSNLTSPGAGSPFIGTPTSNTSRQTLASTPPTIHLITTASAVSTSSSISIASPNHTVSENPVREDSSIYSDMKGASARSLEFSSLVFSSRSKRVMLESNSEVLSHLPFQSKMKRIEELGIRHHSNAEDGSRERNKGSLSNRRNDELNISRKRGRASKSRNSNVSHRQSTIDEYFSDEEVEG